MLRGDLRAAASTRRRVRLANATMTLPRFRAARARSERRDLGPVARGDGKSHDERVVVAVAHERPRGHGGAVDYELEVERREGFGRRAGHGSELLVFLTGARRAQVVEDADVEADVDFIGVEAGREREELGVRVKILRRCTPVGGLGRREAAVVVRDGSRRCRGCDRSGEDGEHGLPVFQHPPHREY